MCLVEARDHDHMHKLEGATFGGRSEGRLLYAHQLGACFALNFWRLAHVRTPAQQVALVTGRPAPEHTHLVSEIC